MFANMKLKPAAKFTLLAVGLVVVFLILSSTGVIGYNPLEALIPKSGEISSTAPDNAASANVKKVELPSTEQAVGGIRIKIKGYAWNGNRALLAANGGPITTQSSLMQKEGIALTYERQDDNAILIKDILASAKLLKENGQIPADQMIGFTAMGDGTPLIAYNANKMLESIGSEYKLKAVAIIGASAGEDQLMALEEIKNNPQAAKGKVFVGYIGDGDWNIAMKWAADNGIKNNPDLETYDADAINWYGANDYIDAPKKYISGYTADKKVIVNGKLTGEVVRKPIAGVVTWTPGDVMVATQKGGLVTVANTKMYRAQMPTTLMVIDKWAKENSQTLQKILTATYRAADQIKAYPEWRKRAAVACAATFREQDWQYWLKYAKGVDTVDVKGLRVKLGGSAVANIKDALDWFGLTPGSANLFAATYTYFGDVLVQQYPNMLKKYPPVEDFVDVSYLQSVAANMDMSSVASVEKVDYSSNRTGETVSKVNENIEFVTGSAELTATAKTKLNKIYNSLVVSDNLTIDLEGYTDNVGNPGTNLTLSEARARSVFNYFHGKSANKFSEDRVHVHGYGQENPVADNSTSEGKARNRRVTIIQKN